MDIPLDQNSTIEAFHSLTARKAIKAILLQTVFSKLFGNSPHEEASGAYSHTRISSALSSCCDGPGSRDQSAGARQTEEHPRTATRREEGVDGELESRHARDEGVKDQD